MITTASHRISRTELSDPCFIALVTDTYPPEINGVANTVCRFATGLKTRGHRIEIIRPRQRKEIENNDGMTHKQVLGLPLLGYAGLRFGLPMLGYLKTLWKTSRPDAIYVATEGPLGWSAIKAANRYGIPVISGFHTNFHSYSHYYHLKLFQNGVFNYLRYFHNQTQATLVPTASLQHSLSSQDFQRVTVVGRGVDVKLFTPDKRDEGLRRRWGLGPPDTAIIAVGRIAPEKNLSLAISAYRAMAFNRPNIQMIIVGDGPELASMQQNNPDVLFVGAQRGEELARHYASADILLFPSETETFGNVILEAMSSGLAVVAYQYAAAAIHIEHLINGLSPELGNQSSFIRSAIALTHKNIDIESIRRQARLHALAHDWPNVIDSFESIMLDTQREEV